MNNLHINISRRFFYNSPARRAEALDPVQELFLKYVREYYRRLKETICRNLSSYFITALIGNVAQKKGVLFDVSPELEKDRQDKYKSLTKQYFGDLNTSLHEQFPETKFEEPELDGINLTEVHPLLKKL